MLRVCPLPRRARAWSRARASRGASCPAGRAVVVVRKACTLSLQKKESAFTEVPFFKDHMCHILTGPRNDAHRVSRSGRPVRSRATRRHRHLEPFMM